jgi:hypothetical protein
MTSHCTKVVAVACVAVLLLAGCQRQERPPASRASPSVVSSSNPLLDTIRARLRAANPAIEQVAILDLRAPVFDSPRRAVLAWGIRKDHQFRGDFRDELFGLFVVNDSLTRVLQALDLIPTPRWLDYAMRIDRVTAESVFVVGKGATYGDGPMMRAYAW